MASLSTILKETANRMHGITVSRDSAYSTVCISDDSGAHDDIFMQGDDADTFNYEVDSLYEKTGDLGKDVIELALAEPYISCIWN